MLIDQHQGEGFTQPLRSAHSQSFPKLLDRAGISLLVSTRDAGRVCVIRSRGNALNTHFMKFDSPRSIAATKDRIAIGSGSEVWELQNSPAVLPLLARDGVHDACYLTRHRHLTGDLDTHEMAWCGDELWLVNTRFSCLSTLDGRHSFVPRWRPSFTGEFGPEDQCHLNGLGVREGRPRYVTALGESSEPGAWRRNKATGGVLIDIESNHVLARGLCMPHSPRWHAGQLWVLESGKGALTRVDPDTGECVQVARFPGFTRGLTFFGHLAFVGVSQVREGEVPIGVPVSDSSDARMSGICVVNVETGKLVALLRFNEAIREVSSLEMLDNVRFPELMTPISHPELHAASFDLPEAESDWDRNPIVPCQMLGESRAQRVAERVY